MEDCLHLVTETCQKRGVAIEVPQVDALAQVPDRGAPTRNAEAQDSLTHGIGVGNLFLIAKDKVEGQDMTSEVVGVLRKNSSWSG